jgi:homoserine dehydrogenase
VARELRLGLLGLGSVGRAFARLVSEEAAWLLHDQGVRIVITGVSTRRSGARVDESGLPVEELLAGGRFGDQVDAADFAATCPADLIVETLPLEPFSGATAIGATRAALRSGRHVVSANKGPVAHACRELTALAAEHGVRYSYESAVADGLPVFNLLRSCLPAADVTSFTGVLNSTSQVVLDALALGGTVAAAVLAAQQAGIAEADPAYDLEGWDAVVKLAALSAAVWDRPLDVRQVHREVVGAGAAPRAAEAAARGRRLMSVAELSDQASVRLVEVGPHEVFYPLRGAGLALTVRSRLLCPITVTSDDPSVRDTAYGLLADVLSID